MNKKRNDRRELSYFAAALFLFLKDSHPLLASDKNLIAVRADSAADTYERMVRGGLSVAQALELANAVLYQDLRLQFLHDRLRLHPEQFLLFRLLLRLLF